LKGHGFSRAAKPHKTNAGFSPDGFARQSCNKT
jgi:hypothetical protein